MKPGRRQAAAGKWVAAVINLQYIFVLEVIALVGCHSGPVEEVLAKPRQLDLVEMCGRLPGASW